eukprot:TRINITY_DN23718_c0_g1_i2.p1 TRINITY_DN23718_c0_g1~~TRINITY_DN23718_c0_g1_i2.p1  ORF type:complete len:104 (+),score=31.25 TRINITY_DN23718_c0_g1_i2:237-548(+)
MEIAKRRDGVVMSYISRVLSAKLLLTKECVSNWHSRAAGAKIAKRLVTAHSLKVLGSVLRRMNQDSIKSLVRAWSFNALLYTRSLNGSIHYSLHETYSDVVGE